MNPASKVLILVGLALIFGGLVWHFGANHIPFGRLPGDFTIQRGNTRIFLPIASCLVVSLLFSLVMRILKR
jgi:hypothetical protein